MTNSCSHCSETDVLTRQVDIRYSGCLGAMEIMSSAFDHRQQGQTSMRLIRILARERASSAFTFLLKGCHICQLRHVQDKLSSRYLIFHQAEKPRDKNNLRAHVGRKAWVPPGTTQSLKPEQEEVYSRSKSLHLEGKLCRSQTNHYDLFWSDNKSGDRAEGTRCSIFLRPVLHFLPHDIILNEPQLHRMKSSRNIKTIGPI